MTNEKIREGFYFYGLGHDFFVETDQQVKSHKLARKIAETIKQEFQLNFSAEHKYNENEWVITWKLYAQSKYIVTRNYTFKKLVFFA